MSGRRPPRGLSSEERQLWERVTQTARPLRSSASFASSIGKEGTEDAQRADPPPNVDIPHDFAIGKTTRRDNPIYPAFNGSGHAPPSRIDKKSLAQISKGKARPEGRLDLHGLTVADAHPALNGFIARSFASGKRLVLVITGKGKVGDDWDPVPQRVGILKQQVPQWLREPGLHHIVLDVAEAHARHGGSGAFYVYLRRNPKAPRG